MRKCVKLMLVTGMVVIAVSGCKKTNQEPDSNNQQEVEITETQDDVQDETTKTESSNPTPSITEQPEKAPMPEEYNEVIGADYHQNIKKLGEQIFYFNDQGIYSINLVTNEMTTICEASIGQTIHSFCINQGMIYYIETANDDVSYLCKLYSVSCDGGEPTLHLKDLPNGTTVSVYENILYLASYEEHSCYAILEDKMVGEKLSDQDTYYRMVEALNIDEAWYSQLLPFGDSLNRYQAIWTMGAEGSLWNININTGEMKEYKNNNQTVVAIQEPYVITMAYEDDGCQFYLWNLETNENTKWFSGQEYYLDSDVNGAYFGVFVDGEAPATKYVYYTWDGTKTELFDALVVAGMESETGAGVSNFSLMDGSIYYQYGEDGKMYLMSRNLETIDTVSRLGDAYLDKHYDSYGHVEREDYSVPFTGDDSRTLIDITYEQFVFEGDSKAVNKINETLDEIKTANVNAEINRAKEEEDFLLEEETIPTYSYTSNIKGITQLSDRYITLEVSEYLFSGGAHGMPIRNYYLFDMTTGERLFVEDVVSESEEEIHTIVASYFEEMYNKAPDAYWPDAMETVKSMAGYNDMFYLTKDGYIVFYFPPYDLAAYAYGFVDVVVPISEFKLKIELY